MVTGETLVNESAGASAAPRGTASAAGVTRQTIISRPAAETRTSTQTDVAAVRQRTPPPTNRNSSNCSRDGGAAGKGSGQRTPPPAYHDLSHCNGAGGAVGKGGGNYHGSTRGGDAVVDVRTLAGHAWATSTEMWAAVYDRAARNPVRFLFFCPGVRLF